MSSSWMKAADAAVAKTVLDFYFSATYSGDRVSGDASRSSLGKLRPCLLNLPGHCCGFQMSRQHCRATYETTESFRGSHSKKSGLSPANQQKKLQEQTLKSAPESKPNGTGPNLGTFDNFLGATGRGLGVGSAWGDPFEAVAGGSDGAPSDQQPDHYLRDEPMEDAESAPSPEVHQIQHQNIKQIK